jgi:hypothetical protein
MIAADHSAGVTIAGVFLPDMNAIGARLGGQIRAIVDDESRTGALGKRHEKARGSQNCLVTRSFQPQLDACNVACGERCAKHIRELFRIQRRRRDQV